MLTVKLNVNEDKELRGYVKDLIKGQIKSLLREASKEYMDSFLDKQDIPLVLEKSINDYIIMVIRRNGDNPKSLIYSLLNKQMKEVILELLKK